VRPRLILRGGQCDLPSEAVGAVYCSVWVMYLFDLANVKERERFLMSHECRLRSKAPKAVIQEGHLHTLIDIYNHAPPHISTSDLLS
jgi:hypothetical protein